MGINLNDFKQETECVYKNEHYSVRDNGAVLRHIRAGKRLRKLDNEWTFGKPNNYTGTSNLREEFDCSYKSWEFLRENWCGETVYSSARS
jgi:hypothetical protein